MSAAWDKLDEAGRREVERQLDIIRRGVAEIVPEEELREKIAGSVASGRPLVVKLGLDPTAPDIHIGHTVVLHKLRQFQQLGHRVLLLIGDFTGRIGDPTGKSETRKPLSEDDVRRNAATYEKQVFKILDPRRTEIVFNSRWLAGLSFEDVLRLAAKVTVARLLERDDFSNRFQNNQPISLVEFFYPLMQGYDSVVLESDVELGGTDQKFNLLMGRVLQQAYGKPPQVAVMMPLLEGLDGVQKMSKSLGNYIGVDEDPHQIYGKAMSVSDDLMLKYMELATDIPADEIDLLRRRLSAGELHPRDAKMLLARTLVRLYHGEKAAEEAERRFVAVFQKREIPDDVEETVVPRSELQNGRMRLDRLLLALGLVSSGAEARRSAMQGAVRINEVKMTDPFACIELQDGDVVQVGRRKFVRVRLS